MPLEYYKHYKKNTEIGIWKEEEGLEYFQSNVVLHPQEEKEIVGLSRRKLLEWYASRYLLHIISGREERGACLKDEYGKPYLTDTEYFISMSHSGDRIAVIASPRVVGIDIQKIVPKITRIAKRFCSAEELSFINPREEIEYLHFLWGAKECIYKSYGKRGVDFKEQMRVMPFQLRGEKMSTTGNIHIDDTYMEFYIIGEIIGEYVLVYTVEKQT